MGDMVRRVIEPVPAASEDLGRWLWALEDGRARTVSMLDDLALEELDWQAPGLENTIGTLLYHIALIECDYLCMDVLGMPAYAAELAPLFPFADRDAEGNLWRVTGVALPDHLARLATVRERLLREIAPMDRERMRQEREIFGYVISPEWTLHHLIQHEAQHRGEIGTIRELYRAQTAP